MFPLPRDFVLIESASQASLPLSSYAAVQHLFLLDDFTENLPESLDMNLDRHCP